VEFPPLFLYVHLIVNWVHRIFSCCFDHNRIIGVMILLLNYQTKAL